MRQISRIMSIFFASSAIIATSSATLATTLTPEEPSETIELKIVKDEPLKGEAQLFGLIRIGGELAPPRTFIVRGEHWLFQATVKVSHLVTDIPLYTLEAQAQHISNLPPHTGEATLGPLLKTPSQNIDDFTGLDPLLIAGKECEQIKEIHQDSDSHYDKLTSILIDLAPNHPSFSMHTGVDGDIGQTISARFITVHTPEP